MTTNAEVYKVYEQDHSFYISTTELSYAKAVCDHINGYVTYGLGIVVYGDKHVGTIDLTPTWSSILPVLLEALTNGTETGKRLAHEELVRMAQIADGKKS